MSWTIRWSTATGVAPSLRGHVLANLTDPGAPATGVADFDKFLAAFADAPLMGCGRTPRRRSGFVAGSRHSYKLSAKTFRDAAGQDLGDVSFADYAMAHFARTGRPTSGCRRRTRTFRPASSIGWAARRWAPPLACARPSARTGARSAIDDIYSGSASGVRAFTLHVLLGDVILVQPDAYAEVSFRVSM